MPWLLKMSLLAAILMLLVQCYVGWRVSAQLKKLSSAGNMLPLFYILLGSFFLYPFWGLANYIFRGDVNMLALWHPLAYWFWFGLVFIFQLLTLVIILDLLRWIVRLISDVHRRIITLIYNWSFWGMGSFLLVFTAAKMMHDSRYIKTEKQTYMSEHIPSGFNHFRIVHISDIHGDEFTGPHRIARYIKKVNALHPDLIIFTGDLISYGTEYIAMAAKELGKARATYGTYAVMGDHDYWAGTSRITAALKGQGIHVLRDENTFIHTKDDSLLLTGVTEVYSKHIARDSLRLLTHNAGDVSLNILASHQPTHKVIQAAQKAHYQLLLAGHTHGGQLRVPFLFMSFSAAELDTPYLSGPFKFGTLLMNVNNGLGFTLAPVRYKAEANISVIDLRAMDQEKSKDSPF